MLAARGPQRQGLVKEVVADQGEQDNFYQMFGLPIFADMDQAVSEQLAASYWQQVRALRPDEAELTAGGSGESESLQAQTCVLTLARQVLEHPDLKRRYDLELRRLQAGDATVGQTFSVRQVGNWVLFTCGVTTVVAGIVLASGGTAIVVGLVGSAALTAGIRGQALVSQDPDCSLTEYVKDLVVGGLQGLAGCTCAMTIGLAPFGAPFLLQYLHAVACGAAIQGSGAALADISDVLCSGGYLGRGLKDGVCNVRTSDDVFTLRNLAHFLIGSSMGPLLAPLQGPPPCASPLLVESEADDEDEDDARNSRCICGSCVRPHRARKCMDVCLQRSCAERRAMRLAARSGTGCYVRTAANSNATRLGVSLLAPHAAAPAAPRPAGPASSGSASWSYGWYMLDVLAAGATVLSEAMVEAAAAPKPEDKRPASVRFTEAADAPPSRPSTPEASAARPAATLFKQPKIGRSARSLLVAGVLGGA